jgi:nucleotide-binding universal stress UspA family protein
MRMLLPIDGSDCSDQTLRWIAETFDKRNTEYYLLFVIPVLPDLNTVEYDIMDATTMLRAAKTEMERNGCNVIRSEYVLGDIVDQICRYAEEIQADQIVLGSHGRTGLAKLLLGSVSTRVLEHCPCNVMIYRSVEKKNAQSGHFMQGNSVI